MNKFIIILIFKFLSSCSSNTDKRNTSENISVSDTIKITERVIDTVYIDKSDKHDSSNSEFHIHERLRDWFSKTDILTENKLITAYNIK